MSLIKINTRLCLLRKKESRKETSLFQKSFSATEAWDKWTIHYWTLMQFRAKWYRDWQILSHIKENIFFKKTWVRENSINSSQIGEELGTDLITTTRETVAGKTTILLTWTHDNLLHSWWESEGLKLQQQITMNSEHPSPRILIARKGVEVSQLILVRPGSFLVTAV